MNVPQQYQIDIAKLHQTLRLQSKFHPDNNLDASVAEQNLSLSANGWFCVNQSPNYPHTKAWASVCFIIINEAYNTLKTPILACVTFIGTQGISQSINQPIRDLEFLDDAAVISHRFRWCW